MQELYGEGRAASPSAPEKSAVELMEEARKTNLASLELAERVEAA